MQTRSKILRLIATGIMLSAFSGPSFAQDPTTVEIEKVTCRDLLLMYDDQEATLVFFHGFMSGKKGEMLYKDQELTEATDKILEHCVDNPAVSVLSVFEQFR